MSEQDKMFSWWKIVVWWNRTAGSDTFTKYSCN